MKLVEQPIVGFDNGITLTMKFPISAREELQGIFDTIEQFNPETDYEISLSKAKKPRSKDANAYMWVLCDKIAKAIRSTKEEVYRRGVREVGVFSDVAVQDGEPCEALISAWESNGIGWFTEVFSSNLSDKDGNQMKRVRLYEGSHNYDNIAMQRLVNWVVEEAKAVGVETLSKEKIKEFESLWKN